ncbi:DUF2987 domain-containing protein [Pseudoalteromonas aurantia]|uniref:DUF2987 domain-containing protein n=2 Tax=Pseudoalteromonas TaxID=53246 RepID=A0A5S3V9B8_9GAMM|nr:DUF2987 domain-containing protein [Pseudoalteromonas aurantia]TMO58633.1 DUF2987 domain-containing protein [Pseudoalteromonas aurantia]TMO67980.1 DUF2987 domain-containing protein [Pseudoalteromonas aurantia]TMO73909.1 DUF2987 domain-containing protein [Pseudoalteromonas aurantia]
MKTNWLVAFFFAFGFSHVAQAKEFVVSYDGFYDRLKVIEKGEFEFARVNFYVVDIATLAPCTIASGKIITEKTEAPLVYTEQAKLLLPFDKQLDKDKAVVVLEPKNLQHNCQLKFQIEAEHFDSSHLTSTHLFQLHTEFDELLADLSGFFVSKLMHFLLPEQKGVVIEFSEPVTFSHEQIQCEDTVCKFSIDSTWQESTTKLLSSNDRATIVTVKPWIEK